MSAARVDRQSAATGGMAGMRAVVCGADQHRGQDRHEAGVAGCPGGHAAAAQGPFLLCESCRCGMFRDTGREADSLLNWSTPSPLATTLNSLANKQDNNNNNNNSNKKQQLGTRHFKQCRRWLMYFVRHRTSWVCIEDV